MVAGVLIRCEPRKESEVLDALRKLEGLSYVYTLFGRYDMVALVRALDLHAASEVVGRIRAIDGVVSTETLVVRPTR
ncbi:MAG: Lrp/AsnC ligand binding domain-containing protein [Candidatus Rokubacteria bacterium]|nr:Lrp/AsnC ligand binding domain-containing protein [Candidatus Rokubacteria bacterium]